MKAMYQDFVENVSQQLAQSILNLEEDLPERARFLDMDIKEILRQVGLRTMGLVFTMVGAQLCEEAKACGMGFHQRPTIVYNVIFGPVEVESPYLWKKGESAKPIKDRLGLTHCGRSQGVEQALSEFGSEESFDQASRRFCAHYGWEVDKTTVLRVTESVAREAETYLETRLEETRQAYEKPLRERAGEKRLLVEVDGCKIRTGEYEPCEEQEDEGARCRKIQWREVRIGLVRGLHEKDKQYVGRMDAYPPVVDQLFSAAVDQGLSRRTQVVAVADGAPGLREELEAKFPRIQFILDRSHLRDNLFETADAKGLEGEERKNWVDHHLHRIDAGQVDQVLEEFRDEHAKTDLDRLRQLIQYIERFQDAVHYEEFKRKGFPIGSGEVESAHRYLPQKRLKLPGACWHPDNVNPMLALRVIKANKWWDDFWEKRMSSQLTIGA
jgi:hypothetical protein